MVETAEFYYKLTFSDNQSYVVTSNEDPVHFLKSLRRFVSSYHFENTVYLAHPVKFELVSAKVADKVYKDWNQK